MTIKEYYEDYLKDFEKEMGSIEKAMTFQTFCDWYGIDEQTTPEDLTDIFWF